MTGCEHFIRWHSHASLKRWHAADERTLHCTLAKPLWLLFPPQPITFLSGCTPVNESVWHSWNGGDFKTALNRGVGAIFHFLVCFSGTPMWPCIKDSCRQLFLLQDSAAQSNAACFDFQNRGGLKERGFDRLAHTVQATVLRGLDINTGPKCSQKNTSLKLGVGATITPVGNEINCAENVPNQTQE